jgi:hypothetical protein
MKMYLSDLEDFIQELKQNEGDIQLGRIDISSSSKAEYLTIHYWNKYGFREKIEKKINSIE